MKFTQAFGILALALSLIVAYEACYPYVPILQQFEPSHFWTGYEDKGHAGQLEIDTNMMVEIADSSLLNPVDSLWEQDSSFSDTSFVVVNEDTLYIKDFESYDGTIHLANFFKKLKELRDGKRKRVRIAYYGDSTTEGDLIVGELRAMLQSLFGGRGVGYVSVAPYGTALRRTLRHRHSENWSMVNYFRKVKDQPFQFGISGDYSTAVGPSMDRSHWLSFRPAWGNYPSMNYFEQVHLFYGQAMDSSFAAATLHYNLNKQPDSNSVLLTSSSAVNRLTLTDSGASQVDLSFDFPNPFPIFGLSFESEKGIIVDNFAKRNDSGSHLSRIPSNIMREFYDFLGCDLVILHFGANVLHKATDYSYYEPVLTAGVRHFQRNMQNVPVLIVGSTDRVAKIEGKEQTTPAVYGLIQAQKKVAVKTRNPFFDLFKKMGGKGTMIKWSKKDPPLVAPDYVHFNHRGGQLIAEGLFDYLMDAYEEQIGDKIRIKTASGFLTKGFQKAKSSKK